MRCEEMSERIPEWLAGELDGRRLDELRQHLRECPGCADEASAFEALWHELGEGAEVEPPATLAEGFGVRLATEIRHERRKVVPIAARGTAPGSFAWSSPLLRVAATVALVASGLFVGSELAERRSTGQIAELRGEMQALHERLEVVSLLAERSASERLRGVAYGRPLSAADERVAAALFDALLNDPDVNVRLAALDALKPRASRPEEWPRLVAAVARQNSPLVQLSLLDVLLASESAGAVRDLEQLLDNPDLDPIVRGYLRDRLERSL